MATEFLAHIFQIFQKEIGIFWFAAEHKSDFFLLSTTFLIYKLEQRHFQQLCTIDGPLK